MSWANPPHPSNILLGKASGKDSQAAARPAMLISAYMLENEVFYVR
jgi:hypothetical protein